MASRERSACEPPRDQRGFALLIVLWAVILLAFLATQLTAAGRLETRIATNLRSSAIAEAAADGAIYEALFHLMDGSPQRWEADNSIHRIRTPRGFVVVRIQDETGKINPNTASPALLAALLRNLGASPQAAAIIAAEIVNWRTSDLPPQSVATNAARYRSAGRNYGPPGAAFESLDELALILDITPGVLRHLVPHLSIYSAGTPAVAAADPTVKKALAEAQEGASEGLDTAVLGQPPLVSITAEARETNGSAFTRSTIIRIEPAADGVPYQVLTWETPAS